MLRFINDIRGPHNLNRFPADWTSVFWITFVQQDPPFWNFDQQHQNKVNISLQCHNNGMKHSKTDVLCCTWHDNQLLMLRLLANLCFTARSPQSGALAISLFWQLSLGSCHHGHQIFPGQESHFWHQCHGGPNDLSWAQYHGQPGLRVRATGRQRHNDRHSLWWIRPLTHQWSAASPWWVFGIGGNGHLSRNHSSATESTDIGSCIPHFHHSLL